jgi:hypothetical protein
VAHGWVGDGHCGCGTGQGKICVEGSWREGDCVGSRVLQEAEERKAGQAPRGCTGESIERAEAERNPAGWEGKGPEPGVAECLLKRFPCEEQSEAVEGFAR